MSASMRIAERRKKLGMTQQELADSLGMHVQRVNAFETGKRNPMTVEVRTAIKIAKALKTSVEKLFIDTSNQDQGTGEGK